ncbi:MAG: transglycosylase SLT domain-containing protein [Patescibacteria group bacterium]
MLRRFFRRFFVFTAIAAILPIFASAQLISCSGPDCTLCDFLKTGSNIINLLTQIAVPISVVFIIYGGFMIMTAGPSEERAGQGRKILTSAIIGVAIVLGSWLILNTVFLILNAQTPTPWNKIQCAAGGPNFGKYKTATGGSAAGGLTGSATDEIYQSAGDGAGQITYYQLGEGEGQVGNYEIQGGLTKVYSDSLSYTTNEDGSVTMTFEEATVATENGMVTVEAGEITIPAEDVEKLDFGEDREGFDTGIITSAGGNLTVTAGAIAMNEGTLNVAGNNVVASYNRETELDNGGMGSGREENTATPRVPSQKTIANINKYDSEVQMAALKYGVTASEVKAVIAQESQGNPDAQSKAGAYGISQLKPETAREMAKGTGYANEKITGEWLKNNPEASIELQVKYYAQQKRYGGDATAGYAGYNGGKGALLPSQNCSGMSRYQCGYDNDAHTVPNKGYAETRDYVQKVAGYEMYFRK